VVRLFAAHWPLHEGVFAPFANRQFISAMMAPLAMAVTAVIHRRFRALGTKVDRIVGTGSALAGGFLALVVVHGELWEWLEGPDDGYAAAVAATALWTAGAGAYLVGGSYWRSVPAWVVGLLALLVAVILGLLLFGEPLTNGHVPAVNWRFLVCLAAVATVFVYAAEVRRRALLAELHRARLAVVLGASGAVLLGLLLSAEAYTSCVDNLTRNADRVGQMAITVVWAAYATSLLILGFWRRHRAVRLAALGLFGLSALKLVLVDMTHLKDIYRVLAFLVVGVLLVSASYFYHRLEKRLSEADDAGRVGGDP